MNSKYKTIHWNEQFIIPVSLPVLNDELKFEIWDQNDGLVKDTIMGSIPISISQIAKGGYDNPKWVSIYGAPVNNDLDDTKVMNMDPTFASRWKGRILMQAIHQETSESRMAISEIPEKFMQGIIPAMNKNEFECCLDVGVANCLPAAKQYRVALQIQGKRIFTELAKNNQALSPGGHNLFA